MHTMPEQIVELIYKKSQDFRPDSTGVWFAF